MTLFSQIGFTEHSRKERLMLALFIVQFFHFYPKTALHASITLHSQRTAHTH